MSHTFAISSNSLLWALQGICQFQHKPFSADLALRQLPPPYNLLSLQHAAHALGVESRLRETPAADLDKLILPCVAVLKPQQENAPEGEAPPHPLALIIKIQNERVVYFEDGSHNPVVVGIAEFAARYAGQVMLFTQKAEIPEEAEHRQQFGFSWFVPELLKHKAIWRDVLLASLAIQLMALATPLFTQVVIDKVVVHHTMNTLIVIAVGMAVFMLFTAALSWVRQYLVQHTGNRIDAVLGMQVFEHLFRLPPRYFEHRPTGTMVARIQGIESIREFLSGAAVTLLLDVPFLLIFLAIMLYYSVALTLIALGILVVAVLLSLAVTPVLRKRINQQFLLGARNQAFLTEYISGMETVKSLQMEPHIGARFGDYFAAYLEAGFNTRQLSNSYNVVASTLEQLLTLAILCVGAWMVMNSQDFTIGMLVAFQMFAGRVSSPMLRIAGLWQEFQQANIAVRRLGDVMNAPVEPYSLTPAREAAGRGEIEVRNLSFRYARNLPYLFRHFDMKLAPGQCVALMGPSGCGKSTLARLLQGFYLTSDGAILVDGHDIRHLSANELRRNFGVVPQETVLFSGTIYDNLMLANPHAAFEQVIQVCKMAEIHEAIERLPQGYQTVIGEHGAGLSGGQKQRLAIARALLKGPKVLIFDEATSSLDPATAEHFAATINQLRGKISMLFIAHQLPRGLKVDEVVTLGEKAGEQEKPVSIVGGAKADDA